MHRDLPSCQDAYRKLWYTRRKYLHIPVEWEQGGTPAPLNAAVSQNVLVLLNFARNTADPTNSSIAFADNIIRPTNHLVPNYLHTYSTYANKRGRNKQDNAYTADYGLPGMNDVNTTRATLQKKETLTPARRLPPATIRTATGTKSTAVPRQQAGPAASGLNKTTITTFSPVPRGRPRSPPPSAPATATARKKTSLSWPGTHVLFVAIS